MPTDLRVLSSALEDAVTIHRYLCTQHTILAIVHTASMNTLISLVSALSLASAALTGAASSHTFGDADATSAVHITLPAGKAPQRAQTQRSQRNSFYQSPTGSEPTILTKFSPGKNNWNPGHRGVDIAMNSGETVYASASGKVIYAGILVNREIVSIEDSRGIRTTYEPVIPIVKAGESVSAGDPIGTITGTHCGSGIVCLHWGAKRGSDSYMNPMWLLYPPVVRLLE